jgi:exodeoxyribonuclease V gamma subunit
MAFKAIHSNRVEQLASCLFDVLGETPLPDPLTPEYVLVDNQVLGEWVNLQLAQQHGIAANIRYIRPHELFWMLARAVVSADIPRETPLSKEEMAWRLFGALGDAALLAQADMSPVQAYLAGISNSELKRYQLASAVADLFDQYLIYRPDWMESWTLNKPVQVDANMQASEAWQRRLWQLLEQSAQNKNLQHRAVIEKALLKKLAVGDDAIRKNLPFQRLAVFGITTMPKKQIELLVLLGKHIDVTLYVFNPCAEYWSLIRSARELARNAAADDAIDEQFYEIGNPLLASQGVQVRDFIATLQEYGDDFDSQFIDDTSVEKTLLQSIQNEIRDLQYKGESANVDYVTAGEKQPVPEVEKTQIPSVHIHSCHSAMREVEVLHDQLRDMLHKNPELHPRDIVVMMPQVAPYVPYIHAVFNAGIEKNRIAYHITDRTLQEESPLLNSITLLLQLPASRMPLSDVVSLLEVPAVQRRFELKQDDYEMLKAWLVASGARWGIDAQHREQQGLPAYSEFSWDFALDRLLAGYAMQVNGEHKEESILALDGKLSVLPFDDIEGGNTAVLDAFLRFWNSLLYWRSELQKAATASVWAERLHKLLADFYQADDENEYQAMKAVYSGIRTLDDAESKQWFSGDIALPVIQALIKPVLKQQSVGKHHWREGVKFCSLLPMRGVPFKVVYILGMNLEDYPRRTEKVSFDLMRKNHRAGDRASRIDDRWLFLEALLSARQYFHVSYIGRDMHRNEKREPSVVLAELQDYLRHGYELADACVQTEHPLQPFGEEYFLADKKDLSQRLISFNPQALAIAQARQQAAITDYELADRWQTSGALLPEPFLSTESVSVSLNDFVQFFTRPWDWFLKCKYQVWLDLQEDGVDDDECYGLESGLEDWQLRNDLLALINQQDASTKDRETVRDEQVQALVRLRQAEGRWPVGAAGQKLEASLQELKPDYLFASQGKTRSQHAVNVVVKTPKGNLAISGDVALHDDCFLVHSASKNRADKQLDFDIRVAIAASAEPSLIIRSAKAVYADGKKPFTAEETIDQSALHSRNHQNLLNVLVGLYLEYQETGLPFDPELAYSIALLGDDKENSSADLIESYWYGNAPFKQGKIKDLKKRIYFGDAKALESSAFVNTARAVWSAAQEWRDSGQAEVADGGEL